MVGRAPAAPAFGRIPATMRRLLQQASSLLALLVPLVLAPAAQAYNDGRGFYGATNDKVVIDAGFILIVFFPPSCSSMSMLQRRLEKRKEARKAAQQGPGQRPVARRLVAGSRCPRERRSLDERAASPAPVRYERSGAAALVTIDRQHRRNAVDGPTAAALHEAYLRFEADEDARVLVLTGAGGVSFCAGADLKATEHLRASG